MDFLELILAMGAGWAVLGIISLSIRDEKNSAETGWGVIVLLLMLMIIAENLLRPHHMPPSAARIFFSIGRNSYFLMGPFLWFYTRALLNEKKTGPLPIILQLLPFLIFALWDFSRSGYPLHPLRNPATPAGLPPRIFLVQLRDILSALSRLTYALLILLRLRGRRELAGNFYSRLTRWNTLAWLKELLLIYLILFAANILVLILPGQHESIITASRIAPVVGFVLLFALFSRNQTVLEDKKSTPAEKQSYEKSGLTPAERQALLSRLETHLRENRSYLDSELTLNKLAEEMAVSRHHLSEALNQEAGVKFYTCINQWRIREFREGLAENRWPEYTLLGAAFECGFRSSSAFYSLFSRMEGCTPKQYAEQLKQKKTG